LAAGMLATGVHRCRRNIIDRAGEQQENIPVRILIAVTAIDAIHPCHCRHELFYW